MLKKYLAVFLSLAVMAGCQKLQPGEESGQEQEQGEGGSEDSDEDEGGSGQGGQQGGEGQDEGGGDRTDDTPAFYLKVTATPAEWAGDYLITYTTSSSVLVFADWSTDAFGQSAADVASLVTSDGIPAEAVDKYKAVFTKVGEYFSINVAGVGYIGYSGSSNSLQKDSSFDGSDNYLWTLSVSSKVVKMHPKVASNRVLQYNEGAPRFACYKTSLKDITLYRRSTPGGQQGTGGGTGGSDEDEGGSGQGGDDTGGTTDDGGGSGQGTGGNDDGGPISPAPLGTLNYYEVPVMNDADHNGIDDKDNTLYYAHHSFTMNSRKWRNYTVCYSAAHHCPVWVCAPRHSCYEGSTKRTDAYGQDDDIPSGIQYNSKDTGGGCNKGHMLGSAERTCCPEANRQVFLYPNIAPQYEGTFNTGGGGWNTLEDWVDTKVCSDTLYVVIGCYFESYKDGNGLSGSPATISFGGRNDVTRPSMFYYVLLRTKSGRTGKPLKNCSASEIQCAAFVRAHSTSYKSFLDSKSKPKVFSSDMMSVADLEKITGFTYFPNVPNAPKSVCTPSDWGL